MELVLVIYKFLLISGGLLLFLFLGSHLIFRLLKKKTGESFSYNQDDVRISQPPTTEGQLKKQLLSGKTYHDTIEKQRSISENRESAAFRKSIMENLSANTGSELTVKNGKSKPRFSVLNERSSSKNKIQNKLEIENEFRIFYQQNYSNTV
jgi:hypothetical protein